MKKEIKLSQIAVIEETFSHRRPRCIVTHALGIPLLLILVHFIFCSVVSFCLVFLVREMESVVDPVGILFLGLLLPVLQNALFR